MYSETSKCPATAYTSSGGGSGYPSRVAAARAARFFVLNSVERRYPSLARTSSIVARTPKRSSERLAVILIGRPHPQRRGGRADHTRAPPRRPQGVARRTAVLSDQGHAARRRWQAGPRSR